MNKTEVYLQTLSAFPLFLATPFISSDLPETSPRLKVFSSDSPRRLTSHYIQHTHAGLLCIVTIIMIARIGQQMFLFGILGSLLQTTGPCVSYLNSLRVLNQDAQFYVSGKYTVLAQSSRSTHLVYVPCHCPLSHIVVSHLSS